MNEEEILENLCTYDKRNPNFNKYYEWEQGERERIMKDCACDNCFYGRNKLALELLKLKPKRFPNQFRY